jgi:hypothetical protein
MHDKVGGREKDWEGSVIKAGGEGNIAVSGGTNFPSPASFS